MQIGEASNINPCCGAIHCRCDALPVYFLNGIRNSASSTTSLMACMFRALGFDSRPLHYEPAHTWSARWARYRQRWAARLLNEIRPGSDIVAHSYGCLLTWEIMREAQRQGHEIPLFRRIVFFAPAMDRAGWEWESLPFERMLVVHNRADRAIKWGSRLPKHKFGNAGRFGFEATDPRIQHHEATEKAGLWRHSYYFTPPHIHAYSLVAAEFVGGPRFKRG